MSADIDAIRGVVTELREELELPTFDEMEGVMGSMLGQLEKNTASPDDREQINTIREALKARGLNVDPRAHEPSDPGASAMNELLANTTLADERAEG